MTQASHVTRQQIFERIAHLSILNSGMIGGGELSQRGLDVQQLSTQQPILFLHISRLLQGARQTVLCVANQL